jgi:hypothetical protein
MIDESRLTVSLYSRDFVLIAKECARSARAGKPLRLVDWCGDRRYAVPVHMIRLKERRVLAEIGHSRF